MTKYEMVNVIVRLNGFRHYLTAGNPIWDTDEVEKIFDTAVEAVEKQMPMPVRYETDYAWGIKGKQPVCPECDSYLTRTVFIPIDGTEGKKISYCDHCGQAIDWSDEYDGK